MKKNGFTLVELLAVIAIVGILSGIAVGNLRGLASKYQLENQVREMYADLMSARMMAMNKNRAVFVNLAVTGQCTLYEDVNNDGTLNTASDTQIVRQKPQAYSFFGTTVSNRAMTWNGSNPIEFNSRGLANTQGTICVYSTVNPSYDCVTISTTRIILGKLTVQGTCNAANCVAK
ncbi:MAG: GspH/FimT family pseudopilin [Syntrophorhabdaceae bacterium]|nr:GspH/FimT family pseudopilin [Syntrophorhabdaceae bacterium]MDD5243115.1 GspH/FimT family pseudopilin [Syntrophorhabdaceae bacterium]